MSKDDDINNRLNSTPSKRNPEKIQSGGNVKQGLQNNSKPADFKTKPGDNAPFRADPNEDYTRETYKTSTKEGSQQNSGADGFKAKGSKPAPYKDSDPLSGFNKDFQKTVDRPSGSPIKVKVSNSKESSLKASIPDSGKSPNYEKQITDRANSYEVAGGTIKNKIEDRASLRKIADEEYNTSLKEKIALSLRYRIPKKLAELDNEVLHTLSNYINQQVEINRRNRNEVIERIFSFREQWRNFEKAGLKLDVDGQHDEHIPLIFEKGKALHARIYKAVMGIEPPFVIEPNKAVTEKQKNSKNDIMRWVTSRYMNFGEGIAPVTDKDIWNFVFDGTSIVKHSWKRDVRKWIDVKTEPVLPIQLDENGHVVTEDKDIESEKVVYDGPELKIVNLEDLCIVGAGAEDIDDADMISERQYYTKSDIIKLANLGFFKPDAAEKVLNYKPETGNKTRSEDNILSQQESRLSGVNQDQGGIPNYIVEECYLRYDIDQDGIDEEIVAWREQMTGTILRLTYLDRVSPNGKRPYVLKKLIPISGSAYGIGIGEMLFGLNNLLDYIANQRLDAGTFQTFPWFVFRAGSGINPGDWRIAPGKGIPVESIQDISFPKVNGNPAYGFQEEQLVTDYSERVSGISRLAQGQVGGQGIARTATGAASLVSELNTNLDIFIQRYQFGFSKSLKIIDKQVQELLPLGIEYRVVGFDKKGKGSERFVDRDQIKFDCDYNLIGNSINSNPAIERDTAIQLLQYSLNPIMIQAGIVSPQNIYNAMKNLLQKQDIRDVDAFITSPEGVQASPYSAQDEINMIAAGVMPAISLNDKHEQKLAYYNEFENSDEFGFLTAEHMPIYAKAKKAHEDMLASIQAQAPMAANSGNMINPALAANIAASSGNPQGGVAQQITDLMPASSPSQDQ